MCPIASDELWRLTLQHSPVGMALVALDGTFLSAIVVADTGIGIGPAEIEHLFTRFFRGHEALARQIPGSGRGLAIVRSIVEAHGGTISLDSTAGEGSTFTVVLPHVAA